ncbi:MAG: hypothetical protein GC160_21950 [Acidobacteria bacterium]|nr:hypothetical protein [Acidobacteriota bacterium]
MRSGSFELVSELGPEAVDPAAAYLRIIGARYRSLGLNLREPGPITAVLTPTIVELSPYLRSPLGRTRGLSLVSPDRNYALVAWIAPGDPLTALAHEYAHLVDPHPERPVWFREGWADYLSYLRPDATGTLGATAPADRLALLRNGSWVRLDALLTADRGSPEFAEPLFYAQSWLIVRWLAEGEPDVRRISPEPFVQLVAERGPEAVAELLQAFLAGLSPAPEAPPAPAADVEMVETLEDREVALRLADLDRWIRPERARQTLERLAAEHPGWLKPLAPLGALEMDAGRYDEAETLLAEAVRDADAAPRTHHRYALLLLRPTDADPVDRAELAALHASLALESQPDDPRFLLTQAQAWMVSGAWDAAVGALRRLLVQPQSRAKAEQEMAELERRRNQALRSTPAPPLAVASPEPLPAALAPPPPKDIPPPAVEPPVTNWPPPHAEVIYGRVDYVDCSGPDKIIVLRNSLFPMRFREPRGRPAKIFFPPDKSWETIPCGAKGWTINLAYRPYRELGSVRGDVVAILF